MTSGDITAWSPPADARTVRPAPTATTRGEAPGESEPKGRGRNMPSPVLIGSPNTLHGLVTDFSETAW
ncbi:hypothetical protein ACWGL8_07370, partial [Streptomyces albidoflavus]